MSDLMLLGVLKMPFDMVMSSPTSIFQYVQRGHEAARRIKSDAVLIEQQATRIAELEHEAGFTKPVDAADSTYPNSLGVAQTLRRCKEDLHTEARFVLWQAARITELEAQLAAVAPAVDAQAIRRIAMEEAADVCDQLWTRYGDADECADAIRALSQKDLQ